MPSLLICGRQQVPLLRVEGRTLRDSTRIIEHVEAAHPDMPVHPGDPDERKRAAEIENFPHLDEAAAFFAKAAAGPGFRLFRLTFATLFRPMMNRYLGLDADRVRASRLEVEEILRRFDREIRYAGPHDLKAEPARLPGKRGSIRMRWVP